MARNAAAILGGRVMSIAIGVALATVLFRRLGVEKYGAWTLLTLISGYSTLMDFGLSAAVERRVAVLTAGANLRAIPPTINTALLSIAAAALASEVIVSLVLVSQRLPPMSAADRRALLVVVPCTAASLASLAIGGILAGQQRMLILSVWRTVGMAVGSGAVMAAALSGVVELDRLLLLYAAGGLLTSLLVWWSARRSVPGLKLQLRWDPVAARDIFWFGGVVQFSTMVPPIAEYVFRIMVSARFGLEYAGVYDLAAKAAFVPRSIAGALFSAMTPFAVGIEQHGGAGGMTALLRTTVRHAALFILPTTAVLLAFSAPIISQWLGSATTALHVRHAFQVLLVAHAVGALAVPAAMIGRARRWPLPEAIAVTSGFGAALLAARRVDSFVEAAGLLWAVPAVAGFMAWGWLTWARNVAFVPVKDVMVAAAIATGAYLFARLLAAESVGWPDLLVRLAVSGTGAGLAMCAAELMNASSRTAVTRLLSRLQG